jgi:hypothetical protein
MTREEAIQRLTDLNVGGDLEAEHYEADKVLCELLTSLGYGDVVQVWEQIDKWYA